MEKFFCKFAVKPDGNSLEGYAFYFDQVSTPADYDWRGKKKFASGCKVNLKEPVFLLVEHDNRKKLASTNGGLNVFSSEKGLKVECENIAGTSLWADTKLLIQDETYTGLSCGFIPVISEYDEKKEIQTFKEIDLFDISIVGKSFMDSELKAMAKPKPLKRRPPEDFL